MLRPELLERIAAEIDRLSSQESHLCGGLGQFVDEKTGEVVRFFSCQCDPDDPRIYEAQYLLDLEEIIWQNTPVFDPNKIDTRHVRRELGDNMVNLGHKVNFIIQGRSRRF